MRLKMHPHAAQNSPTALCCCGASFRCAYTYHIERYTFQQKHISPGSVSPFAFASAAFRVFRAPFRVFRVSQRRLLFRAIPRVPGYSAPFRAPSHSAPSLRFREARNSRLVICRLLRRRSRTFDKTQNQTSCLLLLSVLTNQRSLS